MTKNQYYVYILTNKTNSVLYTGATNNLVKRTWQHKNKFVSSFTQRYNIHKLVYYEIFDDPSNAIIREKQIKNLVRRKKISLITNFNSEWMDLFDKIF